jgi:hypothetical protein
MPLSTEERAFLDAYVYEATHEPFGGPASRDMGQRGIQYSDVHWILTAYDCELRAQGILPFGKENASPPPSPWASLADARRRNEALRKECQDAMPQNGEAAGSTVPGQEGLLHPQHGSSSS